MGFSDYLIGAAGVLGVVGYAGLSEASIPSRVYRGLDKPDLAAICEPSENAVFSWNKNGFIIDPEEILRVREAERRTKAERILEDGAFVERGRDAGLSDYLIGCFKGLNARLDNYEYPDSEGNGVLSSQPLENLVSYYQEIEDMAYPYHGGEGVLCAYEILLRAERLSEGEQNYVRTTLDLGEGDFETLLRERVSEDALSWAKHLEGSKLPHKSDIVDPDYVPEEVAGENIDLNSVYPFDDFVKARNPDAWREFSESMK